MHKASKLVVDLLLENNVGKIVISKNKDWKTSSKMSKKKNKFDLTTLVHQGYLKEGDPISFVSDPKMTAIVKKMLNNEYKVMVGAEITTVHAFATKCLGQEPPNHASQWFKAPNGKTLYELRLIATFQPEHRESALSVIAGLHGSHSIERIAPRNRTLGF